MQVCNAVAVASLLNATLVIPKFLYSNVWKDPRWRLSFKCNLASFFQSPFDVITILLISVICSQFSDIYQEETFMDMLKDDVDIVKELPPHLRSADFEAIGSLVRRLFNLEFLQKSSL